MKKKDSVNISLPTDIIGHQTKNGYGVEIRIPLKLTSTLSSYSD